MMSISKQSEYTDNNTEMEDLTKVNPRYWKTWDQMNYNELLDSIFPPMTQKQVIHRVYKKK